MPEAAPMPMCPMTATCKRVMEKPFPRFVLPIPGITFIVVGVLIIVWPAVLAWLTAAACILMGIAMLMMGNFVRRAGDQFRSMPKRA